MLSVSRGRRALDLYLIPEKQEGRFTRQFVDNQGIDPIETSISAKVVSKLWCNLRRAVSGTAIMSAMQLILIFLFLAFGTLAVTAETESTRMLWAALGILAVGASVILITWDGIKAGRIQLQGLTILRHTRPWLFWAATGLMATSGVVCVGGGLWALTLSSAVGAQD